MYKHFDKLEFTTVFSGVGTMFTGKGVNVVHDSAFRSMQENDAIRPKTNKKLVKLRQ